MMKQQEYIQTLEEIKNEKQNLENVLHEMKNQLDESKKREWALNERLTRLKSELEAKEIKHEQILQETKNEFSTRLKQQDLEFQKELHKINTTAILQKIKEREKQLQTTLERLIKTEEATEGALTCMICMNLFDNPVICLPCGHVYCNNCWPKLQQDEGYYLCQVNNTIKYSHHYFRNAIQKLKTPCKAN